MISVSSRITILFFISTLWIPALSGKKCEESLMTCLRPLSKMRNSVTTYLAEILNSICQDLLNFRKPQFRFLNGHAVCHKVRIIIPHKINIIHHHHSNLIGVTKRPRHSSGIEHQHIHVEDESEEEEKEASEHSEEFDASQRDSGHYVIPPSEHWNNAVGQLLKRAYLHKSFQRSKHPQKYEHLSYEDYLRRSRYPAYHISDFYFD